MNPETLLDTDILSAVMRRRHPALQRAQTDLADHAHFTFSILTRFEILRGLKARSATTQLTKFDRFCRASQVLPLTDAIVVRAAEIYADLHQHGQLIGDADILIAASALEHGLAVITNNVAHFHRIPGLVVDNWLA